MTTKRDYISEILEKRNRLLHRADAVEQFRRRLHPVVAGFRYVKSLKTKAPFRNELLKYGAIGYVACIEGYFRLIIRDLIDSGTPYNENVTGFEEIKFNISSVVSITSKRVTLGEYVAHLVPLNNLSDINRCMSIVLGCDFLSELKQCNISMAGAGTVLTMEQLHPPTFKELEMLFRLRNIYAHELATSEPVRPRIIQSCISSAANFVITTESYLKKRS